jgi:hypothetical protein
MGIENPSRVRRLIEDSIDSLKLDLSGFTVFTEAASRNYVVTSIIAAMSGAKVYALTADSPYGYAKDVKDLTYAFAKFCNVRDSIEVIFEKNVNAIASADIVTNLGFVRPIDASFVGMMKELAVVSYMYEAWEYRQEDVDIAACRSKNIPVMATNEEIGNSVFSFCGNLCLKMLFQSEIEVYESRIAVVSRDKFGRVIEKYLKAIGSDVHLIADLRSEDAKNHLDDIDALVVADYNEKGVLVGSDNAQISAANLRKLSEKVSIIQFAGDVDIEELNRFQIPYYPSKRVGKNRMGMTLADLGPKPVIELHSAGLKVGEALARARRRGLSWKDSEKEALEKAPAERLAV